MNLMHRFRLSAPVPAASAVRLVPGDRFFVRRIALAPDVPPAVQAELALETGSPFDLDRLYHGQVVDAAGRHALVYAAYRRNFSSEELAEWEAASAVLPDFLFWTVAGRPPGGRGAVLRQDDRILEAVAWDEASELPAVLLTRKINGDQARVAAHKTRLLAEISRRSSLPADQVRQCQGPVTAGASSREGLTLLADGVGRGVLPAAALAQGDVRDRAMLAARRKARRRAGALWRAFAGVTALLAVCLLLELALWGGREWLAGRSRQLAERAPAVAKIESALNLASRMEKMTAEQLRPMEMLAAINAPRPVSVRFSRVSTTGPLQLVVQAWTDSPGDLRGYQNALLAAPGVAAAELHDLRMSGGRTTFDLDVTFKPGWLRPAAGS